MVSQYGSRDVSRFINDCVWFGLRFEQEPGYRHSLDLYHVPSIPAPVSVIVLASDFQLLAPPENSELFWSTLTEEA